MKIKAILTEDIQTILVPVRLERDDLIVYLINVLDDFIDNDAFRESQLHDDMHSMSFEKFNSLLKLPEDAVERIIAFYVADILHQTRMNHRWDMEKLFKTLPIFVNQDSELRMLFRRAAKKYHQQGHL